MRRRNSRTMWTSRLSSRSKCSATEPASEFSMGITAPSTRAALHAVEDLQRTSARHHPGPRQHGFRGFVTERTKFSLNRNLHQDSSLVVVCELILLRRSKLFRHDQSIQLAGIVPGNRLFHEISFLFVEADRGFIIHWSLQRHGERARAQQVVLRQRAARPNRRPSAAPLRPRRW